jgi:uncharacterized protein involved in type VI secretion and phage assembly
MAQELIRTIAGDDAETEFRIEGVAPAKVINNIDLKGLGRVQVQLPWLPQIEPWARVAVLSAGPNRGTWFIPQIDDEVLVAFHHGDVRKPYIIGSLWNNIDEPPADLPTDSVTKRIIRTPVGHQVIWDDLTQSMEISTSTQQQIKLTPESITVSTTGDTAKLTMQTSGNVRLEAAVSLELKAPKITIDRVDVEIMGSMQVKVDGGAQCSVKAALVRIN